MEPVRAPLVSTCEAVGMGLLGAICGHFRLSPSIGGVSNNRPSSPALCTASPHVSVTSWDRLPPHWKTQPDFSPSPCLPLSWRPAGFLSLHKASFWGLFKNIVHLCSPGIWDPVISPQLPLKKACFRICLVLPGVLFLHLQGFLGGWEGPQLTCDLATHFSPSLFLHLFKK